jgi:3-phosphoshikimate 1-carboxyvinyltransferase
LSSTPNVFFSASTAASSFCAGAAGAGAARVSVAAEPSVRAACAAAAAHFSQPMQTSAALAAQRAGLGLDQGSECAQLARQLPVRFEGDRIFLDGQDVSESIRTEEAGMAASQVSVHPPVRDALTELQRSFRRLPGLVADGRDMGTVIFPDATLKVFLTASAGRRAQRRHKQLISKGISVTLAAIESDLEARDARDKSRSAAPLKPAQDALQLDNSELSIEASIDQMLVWWQGKRPL